MAAEQQDNAKDMISSQTTTPTSTTRILTLLNALPDEMLEFILTYLPPYGDLENCSLVCKRWNEVVRNLVRRSKINLENGLIDFRLRWEVFTHETAKALESARAPLPLPAPPPPIIAGRFAHSAVRHENAMYVFGGASSTDTTFNDMWRFDLTYMRWERPLSMGTYPSPKGSASMISWRDQLVLFGGWRYPSLHPPYQPWCLFDELHYYELATNRWHARNLIPCPPAMAGHSASVHGDRMIVFGGYQIVEDVNVNSNDTWVLDLIEQRWWQPRFVGNTRPSPRYGQIQVELDEQHLLIVGGCGGANRLYSDAWVLDMTRSDVWVWRSIPVRNKKFGALHMWCNPACKVNKYLVVLGPTPNMPQDFQMMKQSRVPVGGGGGGVGAARMGVLGQPPPPPPPPGLRNREQQQQQLQQRDMNLPAAAMPGRRAVGDGIAAIRPLPQQGNRIENNLRLDAGAGGAIGGHNDQYIENRRAILNQHVQQAIHFLHNNNLNNINNNNINGNANGNSHHNNQPRAGRLRDLHASAPAIGNGVDAASPAQQQERNHNRPTGSNNAASPPTRNGVGGSRNDNEDIEAANRLQRNLALRCRDNEPLLPKRFDELYEDPFRMAAFNVHHRSRSASRDHNERIRRMEEKMNAIRNSRRSAVIEPKATLIKEPSPKRVRRNVQSLFVCDIAQVLDATDPYLEWIEYKNFGVVPGAPERLILSSLVAGNGELILFGGVHKETLSGITHHVSNSLHFLSAPRDIV